MDDAASVSVRLSVLSTDAEQRWLSGQGEQPLSAAERLPPRAPVLVPRSGVGSRLFPAAEVRVAVRDGAVVLWRGDRERCLAEPGTVRRVVWIAPEAIPATTRTWPAARFGYVLLDADEPRMFRVEQWYPGGLDRSEVDALRLTGFEALARALDRPLEVVTAVGAVRLPPGRALVNPYRGVVHPIASIVTFLAALVAPLVLAVLHADLAAIVVGVALALATASFDVAAVLQVRRWRRGWIAAAERVYDSGGNALLLRQGRAGPELAVLDRGGWGCWLPGPQLGGAASLVVAREAAEASPWALLLLDRDDRFVAALPAGEWVPGPDAVQTLTTRLAGPNGLAVDSAVVPRWPDDRLTRPRVGGRPVDRDNDYLGGGRLGLAAMVIGIFAGTGGLPYGVTVYPFGAVAVLAVWALRRRLR